MKTYTCTSYKVCESMVSRSTGCAISSFGMETLNTFEKNMESAICLFSMVLYNSCRLLFENNIEPMAAFIFDYNLCSFCAFTMIFFSNTGEIALISARMLSLSSAMVVNLL